MRQHVSVQDCAPKAARPAAYVQKEHTEKRPAEHANICVAGSKVVVLITIRAEVTVYCASKITNPLTCKQDKL